MILGRFAAVIVAINELLPARPLPLLFFGVGFGSTLMPFCLLLSMLCHASSLRRPGDLSNAVEN
ncbi:MAG: hypothetical protein ABSD88_06300 [Candidatus Korobacteraceae bacterium]